MPTYEYECKSCAHTFDAFQSMADEALKICPKCGKELRRLINGGSGIIFKGSGFYVTDKNKGGSSSASRDKAASGNSEAPKTACAGCAATAQGASCPNAVNTGKA